MYQLDHVDHVDHSFLPHGSSFSGALSPAADIVDRVSHSELSFGSAWTVFCQVVVRNIP